MIFKSTLFGVNGELRRLGGMLDNMQQGIALQPPFLRNPVCEDRVFFMLKARRWL